MRKLTGPMLAVAIALGVFMGVGSFTFHYGNGTSYFSQDPSSCVNCHIMRPQYDSWHKSSHAHVATCVDCHMPTDFPHNLIAKADNGWNHSWAFTFQDFHEPIQIKPRNSRILENNCLRCHDGLVQGIAAHHNINPQDAMSCIHCHAGVGHGPVR
ncbi:MAG TPA: cytochrome c nitrite reductase small subunit [Phycisphaerales bacterium]|nr:cytochrome c nitrite reductase small subunit [Phycisphaerales bacterium]